MRFLRPGGAAGVVEWALRVDGYSGSRAGEQLVRHVTPERATREIVFPYAAPVGKIEPKRFVFAVVVELFWNMFSPEMAFQFVL